MLITLKAARLLMSMPQTELMKQIGVSQGQISKVENGVSVSEKTFYGVKSLFEAWRRAEIDRLETKISELRRFTIDESVLSAHLIERGGK